LDEPNTKEILPCMKVLFVTSGNSKYHQVMPAFIRTQADSLIAAGVNLEFYQIIGKGVKGYLKNISPLKQKLKEGQYDIIHAHYGFCGIVAALARRNEKLLVSFMGESEFIPDKEDRGSLFVWLMVILHRIYARWIFDFVIFKSENLSRFVKGINHKSAVLPNGVNLNVFKPMDKPEARNYLNLPIDHYIVLWIGNQSRPVKGYSIAEKAVNLLKTEYPNLHFLAVNNIPNVQLPYYYNAADVFLLSSLSEGSPNVVKEAMACNCPIVATEVGDVNQLLDGVVGCKVSKSFTPEDISTQIKKLLIFNNRSEGLNRIISLGLDSRQIAARLVNIYSNLLA
jgi:teichuronic acid biosynthesis glycosyltransferase TuaC